MVRVSLASASVLATMWPLAAECQTYEYSYVNIAADSCIQVAYNGDPSEWPTLVWSEEGVNAVTMGGQPGGTGWEIQCAVEFIDTNTYGESHVATISDFDAWGTDLCSGTQLWLSVALLRRDKAAGSSQVVVEDCIIDDGETTCEDTLDNDVNDILYSYFVSFGVNPGDELCWRAKGVRIQYRWPD